MKPVIYFDIETGPLPEDQIRIPPFDPSEVKLGNVKDPAKIEAKLKAAEANHRQSIIDNAALDALTGQVLLIAYEVRGEAPVAIHGKPESEILKEFWDLVTRFDRCPFIIGFNIKGFDLPFLVRRSWALGVTVPGWIRQGRFWHDFILDVREMWQLGDSRAKGSLEAVSQHLGLGGKTGDGALFYKLYAKDPVAAVAYALRDVELVHLIHQRIAGGF
jgi:hypothetical protein